MANQVHIL